MAHFPALVFIPWQAVPSAVGLPTQITPVLLVEKGWRSVRAWRFPHPCGGDSPSDSRLQLILPLTEENPPCCLLSPHRGWFQAAKGHPEECAPLLQCKSHLGEDEGFFPLMEPSGTPFPLLLVVKPR